MGEAGRRLACVVVWEREGGGESEGWAEEAKEVRGHDALGRVWGELGRAK
jgi:hypothetical protein